ncbi:hypothetical protein ACFXDJ_06880 [Streptomyces sp. NPDC059443]|uniref:hypothetical protein n=1 Tax=unclassified Streptomyces TaxID=2593676 RepID=UPI0036CFE1B6
MSISKENGMTEDPERAVFQELYACRVIPSAYSLRKKVSTRPANAAQNLAKYFFACCPSFSWAASTEKGPFPGGVKVFGELLRGGADPQTCVALVDLYFARVGNRPPTVPYIWHFKGMQYRLLAELNERAAEPMTQHETPNRLNPTSPVSAIETRYAGCRFRSRLEARWAVLFDTLGVRWEYEPQGFTIPRHGGGSTPYLPDFYLPQCGTWVEVKGSEAALDRDLMEDAARALPRDEDGPYPVLLLLGPVPEAPAARASFAGRSPWRPNWGWLGLSGEGDPRGREDAGHGFDVRDFYYGFNGSADAHCLSEMDISGPAALSRWRHWGEDPDFLTPYDGWFEETDTAGRQNRVRAAYEAARGARFEHGERGFPRAS